MRWILVDRLIECQPGERAVALKTFPRSDLLFADHFPGLPTVPGVLQLEALAQTAGKCIRMARPDRLTLLASVRSARFYRRVGPGDTCRLEIEVSRLRDDMAVVTGVVRVDGERTCQAELMFGLVARPEAVAAPWDAVAEDWRRAPRPEAVV